MLTTRRVCKPLPPISALTLLSRQQGAGLGGGVDRPRPGTAIGEQVREGCRRVVSIMWILRPQA